MPQPFSKIRLPRRLLVTRTDRLGDVVLSTPVLKALREVFPGAYITACVSAETREIVEGNPYLDEVIVYDKQGREKSLWGTIRFALGLVPKHFDAVIHLHPTHRVHWVSFLAGIPVRIGYRRKSGWLLTHALADRKHEGLKHEAEYNFDLLRFLGIEAPPNIELCFPLKKEADERFRELCAFREFSPQREPYAVLHPSASCPSKVWPPERFAELADALWRRYGFRTVLIGRDAERSLRVKDLMKTEAVDLTGELSLSMLASCLKAARVLVSNDSGPCHVAAACGTPVLAIFGRNQAGLSPVRWRPLGERSRYVQRDVGCFTCLAHACKIRFLCLEVLSACDVLDALVPMEPYFAGAGAVGRGAVS
jgi:heptosyltransferase-2